VRQEAWTCKPSGDRPPRCLCLDDLLTRGQLNLGRTWRITLNRDGTYSRVSVTSLPKVRKVPPQAGQLKGASCLTVSRGSFCDSARRAGSIFSAGGSMSNAGAVSAALASSLLELKLELRNAVIELFGIDRTASA
jgi:hypothetical protein